MSVTKRGKNQTTKQRKTVNVATMLMLSSLKLVKVQLRGRMIKHKTFPLCFYLNMLLASNSTSALVSKYDEVGE